MSLRERAIAEEQMDAADLPEADYAALLGDLAQVNALTLAARPTLAFLARVARRGDRLRLLDVGFGHGDMLRRIARWASRRGVEAELVGIDLNPRSAIVASAATDPALRIHYRTGDYAALAGAQWDVIVSSLVAHHMTEAQLVAFLRFMEAEARRGWLVNDLHRHAVPHLGFPLLARLMRWHRIVREDGTLSIARSYRPADWPPLLAAAGIPADAARVRRVFPFRLCVERLCADPTH
jgi:SAM-dependent methyltransferase